MRLSKQDRAMVNRVRGLSCAALIASLICCLILVLVAFTPPAVANEVVQWNETAMKAIEANGQSAVVATRTLAMAQAAVHDAVNAISRRYNAYYFEGPGDPAGSPDAAAAAAAHTVLVGVVNLYGSPAQKGATLALLDQAYAESIARVSDGTARNKGVAVGRAAGAAILSLRKDDGATRDAPYTPAMGPGKWRPHPNPVPPTRPSPTRTWLAAHALGGPGLGERHAVHVAVGLAILASRASGVDERGLRPRLQRGEEHRRQGQHGAHRRPDAGRTLLVRGAGRVEPDRAYGGHRARP